MDGWVGGWVGGQVRRSTRGGGGENGHFTLRIIILPYGYFVFKGKPCFLYDYQV